MTETHQHHIVPRWKGGSDGPDNMIELDLKEHCLWHAAEYLRTGEQKDWHAWQLLKAKVRWYAEGKPLKPPPPEVKKGSREWKIQRLYAMHGGKMHGVLLNESVDSVYKRMNQKGRRTAKRKK